MRQHGCGADGYQQSGSGIYHSEGSRPDTGSIITWKELMQDDDRI